MKLRHCSSVMLQSCNFSSLGFLQFRSYFIFSPYKNQCSTRLLQFNRHLNSFPIRREKKNVAKKTRNKKNTQRNNTVWINVNPDRILTSVNTQSKEKKNRDERSQTKTTHTIQRKKILVEHSICTTKKNRRPQCIIWCVYEEARQLRTICLTWPVSYWFEIKKCIYMCMCVYVCMCKRKKMKKKQKQKRKEQQKNVMELKKFHNETQTTFEKMSTHISLGESTNRQRKKTHNEISFGTLMVISIYWTIE